MGRYIDKYAAACAVVDFENFLKLHRNEKWFREVYNKACELEMKLMDLATSEEQAVEE